LGTTLKLNEWPGKRPELDLDPPSWNRLRSAQGLSCQLDPLAEPSTPIDFNHNFIASAPSPNHLPHQRKPPHLIRLITDSNSSSGTYVRFAEGTEISHVQKVPKDR